MAEFSVVGKSVPRVDALEKVTGKARFTTDIKLPGMLYGKVLRSPFPHAKILSIDKSEAMKLPGVRAVVTGKDIPDRRYGLVLWDKHILARDRVRFAGEPVAAVAADSVEIAEEALGRIKVQYEELPAIFDVEESLKPDPKVVIHPELPKYEVYHIGIHLDPSLPNVNHHFKIRKGDVEKGFQEADLVIENRFETARVQHCPPEPHVAIVTPEVDGGLTVWAGTQGVHLVRKLLSQLFEIPLTRVRVIAPYIGAGFGGKAFPVVELIAAALALKTGRHIKLTFDRSEVFLDHHVIPAVTYIKDGVKKDGTLIAREMKVIEDGGGYAIMSAQMTPVASHGAIGSYRIPNFKWDSYGVYTNQAPTGALRSVTNAQIQWAIECQMDIIARKLRIDPVEFRKKNILKEGEANLQGEIVHSIGAVECLEKAAASIELGKKPEAPPEPWRKGKGIALANMYSTAPIASCATVKVHPDAMIEVLCSPTEMGQGSDTVLSQIAAEEFGVSMDKIKLVHSDTAVTPYDYLTGSSKTTYVTGNAIRLACQDAKRQLFELSSARLNASPESLETREGKIYVKAAPEKSIHITDLFTFAATGVYLSKQSEIVGKATYEPPWAPPNPETGLIDPELARRGIRRVTHRTYGAQAAEVAVDVETGEVKVTKFSGCFDICPINPKLCEAQMEGGAMMGIGNALLEEQIIHEGIVMNPNYTDYRIPTAGEMPDSFESIIAPTPHKDGPYGAKGLGEAVIVPTAPAIANAIYDAVGVRIKDIPITAEKILRALKEKGVR